VAANLSLNERRRARELPLAVAPGGEDERLVGECFDAGPELLLDLAEQRAALRAAVAALAPRQRAMVVLRYFGDCSLEEVGVALGCRPGTVRATLHQALKRLRAAELDVVRTARPAPSDPLAPVATRGNSHGR
jgi:RNA polymerase sigma factor (sigma-70 family)